MSCNCGCLVEIPKGDRGLTGATGSTGANGNNGTDGQDGAFAGLVKGYQITTIGGGAVVTLTPGNNTSAIFQRFQGTATLNASNFVVQINGTPTNPYTDGDFIEVEYEASLTMTSGVVTILGIALSTWEAKYAKLRFIATYDLGTTTWNVQKIVVKTEDPWHSIESEIGFNDASLVLGIGNDPEFHAVSNSNYEKSVYIYGDFFIDSTPGTPTGISLFDLPGQYWPTIDLIFPVFFDDASADFTTAWLTINASTGEVRLIFQAGMDGGDNFKLSINYTTK